jgi:AcrR family transcriptional regulator
MADGDYTILRKPRTLGIHRWMTLKQSAKPPRLMTRKRELARETILLAAENLLEKHGRTDFSMRELSQAAGVSFVTPFNHFGSKDGLLRELMFRRFERIEAAFERRAPDGDAISRTFTMAEVGVEVLLTEVSVGGAASVGIATQEQGELMRRASSLWKRALGDYDGLDTKWSAVAAEILPEHLAVFFRGAQLMWVVGDLSPEQFGAIVETGVASILAGFCGVEQKFELDRRISARRELLSFD